MGELNERQEQTDGHHKARFNSLESELDIFLKRQTSCSCPSISPHTRQQTPTEHLEGGLGCNNGNDLGVWSGNVPANGRDKR